MMKRHYEITPIEDFPNQTVASLSSFVHWSTKGLVPQKKAGPASMELLCFPMQKGDFGGKCRSAYHTWIDMDGAEICSVSIASNCPIVLLGPTP